MAECQQSYSIKYYNGLFSTAAVALLTLMLNVNNLYLGFHEIAQILIGNRLIQSGRKTVLEYNTKKQGEADVVSYLFGRPFFVWEIKPDNYAGANSARAQIVKYTKGTGLIPGFVMSTMNIRVFDFLTMRIRFLRGGIALYSFFIGNRHVTNAQLADIINLSVVVSILMLGCIIGVTIIEDIVSGGVGIINDVPTVMAGTATVVYLFQNVSTYFANAA